MKFHKQVIQDWIDPLLKNRDDRTIRTRIIPNLGVHKFIDRQVTSNWKPDIFSRANWNKTRAKKFEKILKTPKKFPKANWKNLKESQKPAEKPERILKTNCKTWINLKSPVLVCCVIIKNYWKPTDFFKASELKKKSKRISKVSWKTLMKILTAN